MVSKGSKPGGPLIALMWSELISTSLLVDLLSRERVQWSIRLIIVLANGFALLNTFCKSLQNYNYKYDLRHGWANDAASIAVICGCGRHRISPEYSKNIIQCGNKIDNGCCSNPATIPKARRKSNQLLGQSFAVDRLIETGKGRGLNEYYNTPEYRSIFLAGTFTTVARAEQLISHRLPDLLGHNPSASRPIHSRQEG